MKRGKQSFQDSLHSHNRGIPHDVASGVFSLGGLRRVRRVNDSTRLDHDVMTKYTMMRSPYMSKPLDTANIPLSIGRACRLIQSFFS
jgi:hypothetical protein